MKVIWNRSERKAMITVFFHDEGVVHSEYLSPGETVETEYYCDVLRRLKESVRCKCPGMWKRDEEGNRTFLLHHDNAPPHTSVPTLALIGSSSINMVPHPPYSPDLAPCDYFLFPRLKSELRGHRHRNIQDLKTAVDRTLRQIPQDHYRDAILSIPIQWMKCIKANGNYFEGHHLQIDPLGDHQLHFEFGESKEED